MPKYATVADHLEAEELKRRYQHAKDPVESRRYHLLWLVKQHKYSLKQAASGVGLNYDYGKDILKAYNQEGPDALRNRRRDPCRRGRPPLLNCEQMESLRQVLESPPADGGLWSASGPSWL
ncbi:MAG: helix-turn-helix domain-containing protein [Cyanobacteria bacterium J06642_2]